MFVNIKPHTALRSKVKLYWMEETIDSREKVLPDASVCLIFNLGDDVILEDSEKNIRKIKQEVVVLGPHKKYHIIYSSSNRKIFGVKLHDGVAGDLFQCSVSSLVNKVVQLDALMNYKAIQVYDRVWKSTGPMEAKQIVDGFLLSAFKRCKPDLKIQKTLEFFHTQEKPSIHDISEKINISQKHLIHLFKEKIGFTPKYYLRVLKFQNGVEMIKDKEIIHWPSVAGDCGYYDQAHFSNEFRYFSGSTPTNYIKYKIVNGQRIWLR